MPLRRYACFRTLSIIARVQLVTSLYILAMRNCCFKINGCVGRIGKALTPAPASRAKASGRRILYVLFSPMKLSIYRSANSTPFMEP